MHVDDGGAVDLPERRGVELLRELLDRLPDQRLAFGGHYARVFAVGLEVADVLDRDDVHRLPLRRVDPAQEAALRRSEEHTSELQSRLHLVCRLLLEKKKEQ